MSSTIKHFAAGLSLLAALSGFVSAGPVTGPWTKASGGATMALTNTLTASPTWGDGTTDNADASSIYSAFPEITLANAGDRIELTGSITLVRVTTGGENLRFGLFDVNGRADTTGWLGYFVRNGSGTGVASIMERAAGNTGAFTSTTGAANVGTAPIAGSVVGPTASTDTFTFTVVIERNATNGVLINSSLIRTDLVDFSPVVEILDASPQTFKFNRVGFQGTTGLNADQIQLTNVAVTLVPAVVAPPVITSMQFTAGQFEVGAVGMEPSRTYLLKRSSDLATFPDSVESFTGSAAHIFVDPSPPSLRAFYRIEPAQ